METFTNTTLISVFSVCNDFLVLLKELSETNHSRVSILTFFKNIGTG